MTFYKSTLGQHRTTWKGRKLGQNNSIHYQPKLTSQAYTVEKRFAGHVIAPAPTFWNIAFRLAGNSPG
jgi:hypothetical protein